MKIGILTIHKSPSYGGSLQSFALWKYLCEIGHDVEVIDLYRPWQKEYRHSKRFVCKNRNLMTEIKKIIKKVIRRKNSFFLSDSAERKFAEFNSMISFSAPYFGPDALYKNPPVYDVYITGSDQVWNPHMDFCNEPYFLTFAPEGAKKISYASSVGVCELERKDTENFAYWLSSYSAISVREECAKKILQPLVKKNIRVLPDPTMLLDNSVWKSLAVEPSVNQPFILLFLLDGRNVSLVEFCVRLSRESGLQLIILGHNPVGGDILTILDAGPREFLGYISAAEMVITDSFHGTVFSLILGTKNFYSFISKNSKNGSRITNLLETCDLCSHLLDGVFSDGWSDLVKNIIDKKQTEKTLTKLQQEGRDFLSKELDRI